MPKLLVEKGNNRNTVVSIAKNKSVTIGRETDNELQLHDIMSSRKHFRIYHENSTFVIEDLNSSNGTFVNGKRITKQTLNVGDKIQVGDTLMSILSDKESQKSGGMIGKELGGYKIIERLGRGAMGTVFKAIQKSLDRVVALKILAPELLKNNDFINMFVKEARASGQLNHPNIIQVYDVGDFKGVWYFSMEYAEYGSVADKIENNQLIPLTEAIPMIIEASKGLEYAERKQIVHRDIKPDNLFIGAEHVVKLGDLGLAQKNGEREEEEGVFGTPHYIAPEQAMGQNVDQRADIYSLGATFYRMIVGVTPFQGANVKEVLRKQVKEEPPEAMLANPTIPKSISDIIKKMMAKDPAYRFQSATDVIKALEKAQKIMSKPAIRRSPAISANKPMSASKYMTAPKKSSNLPVVLAITALVIVAVIIVAVFAMKSDGKDPGSSRTEYTGSTNGSIGSTGTVKEIKSNNTESDDDDEEIASDDDDDTETIEKNDNNNADDDDNKTVKNNDDNKTPPGDFSKRKEMFERARLHEEMTVKIREICKTKKLAQICADDFEALESIAKAFDDLAAEYQKMELFKNIDDLIPEQRADKLRSLISDLKKQVNTINMDYATLESQVNSLMEKTEYTKAYSAITEFQTKYSKGAFKNYNEFVINLVEGDQDVAFSKVKESRTLANKIEEILSKQFDEIEKAFKEGYEEFKKLTELSAKVDKLEALIKPYQDVIDKWGGIKVFKTKAEERVKELKIELDQNMIILKQKAAKASQEFASNLGPAIRDAFDLALIFNFEGALKKLEKLEKLTEYKLCLEQAEKDKTSKRLTNIYKRMVEQIKYGMHFMKSFERDLNRANSIKIDKPDCIHDYDVVGDTITIKGYKDGKLEVRRSGSSSKGNLFVSLYEINGDCMFELMNEAMKLSKEKDPKVLIGAGFVLMIKQLPNYAIKAFEKAASISKSDSEKKTIKEFLAYAFYDEINRLNSIGKGSKARELLEEFNKEFSETDAYKDIFDPPISVPPSKGLPPKNSGKGF